MERQAMHRWGNDMKRLIIGGLIIVGVISQALAQPITDSVGQTVDAALDAQVALAREMRSENIPDKYDPAASVALLRQLVAGNPDYYRARFGLALSLYELDPDKRNEYMPEFERAMELEERLPEVTDGAIYNTVGWIEMNDRNYQSALPLLLRALSMGSTNQVWTNSAVNYNLGRLYLEMGDLKTSQEYLAVAATKFHNPAAVSLKAVVDSSLAVAAN